MSNLNKWIEYGKEMKIGGNQEVYYWEDSVSPGYTNDLCLFLSKPSLETFSLYIMSPQRLCLIEETESLREDDPDFFPDEINGQAVRRCLGEYYIGYDFSAYPNPNQNNEILFHSFSDPKVTLWLKKNGLKLSLEKIEPEKITTSTW